MKDQQNEKQLELPDSSRLVRKQFQRKKTRNKKNTFSPSIPPRCTGNTASTMLLSQTPRQPSFWTLKIHAPKRHMPHTL